MSRKGKRKDKKNTPASRWRAILGKPWIFAGAAFGLDLAMLAAGLALSVVKLPVEYTANGDSIERSQPLAFFGVTAAVVIALVCVLVGFIAAGAVLKKRKAVRLAGAAGLLIVSLAMVGGSAFMALGPGVKSRQSVSYSDEFRRMIVEETQNSLGGCTAAFFLTGTDKTGEAKLVAETGLREYCTGDLEDRYAVSWLDETTLQIGFEDGTTYRTLSFEVE